MAPSTARQFRETVALVAARAKAKLPEQVNGRIEGAVKLVLSHDVVWLEDGTIEVGSSSDPLKVYHLSGLACTCKDFTDGKAPEGWCRHRIAAGIQKRVRELLPVEPPCEPFPDNDPGPVEELPPTPAVAPTTPAPTSLPEAVFSLTLKGFLDGQEALLTARGMTVEEFTRNLQAIRGLLDAPAPPAREGEGWCSQHGLQMHWNEGKAGRKGWFSHRTAEGQWCKGR